MNRHGGNPGPNGNLGRNERLLSLGAGAVLGALASRGSGPTTKLLFGLGAAGFLMRSLAGHCAMKAALTGESTLGAGISEQWRQTRLRMGAADRLSPSMSANVAAAEKPVREQGETQDETSWMSHHSGRVTGTAVTPGAGDSEAGSMGRA